MKNTTITMLGLSLCALASFTWAQDTAPAPAPAAQEEVPAYTDAEIKEVISYFLGYQSGQQFATDGAIEITDLDKEVFYKGIADGLKNQPDEAISKKDIRSYIMAFSQKLEERGKALSDKNIAASNAYAAENAKKEGVKTTESGLQYRVITPSEGRTYDPKNDGVNASMSVTYEGRLLDGTVFDQSAEPIPFPLDGVIPGFSEALKIIPIGAEYEFFLPSSLGYGDRGPGILGNNAALIFKVKLHDITPAKGKPDNPAELTPELLQQLQDAGLPQVQQ